MAGIMKIAFIAGKAPADFASMSSKLYPVVVTTPIIKPFGLTSNQFIILLAVFELIASLALFYRPKIGAIMTAVVMAGAEYVACTEATNPAMPPNPMCAGKAACLQSHLFHAIIVLMAVVTYRHNIPLCSSVAKAWQSVTNRKASSSRRGSSSNPETTTPSRPRRAAAMKKKDL
jgi:hypothetical protein